MPFLLSVALILGSTLVALGEEAYQQTKKAIGVCIGLTVRPFVQPGSPKVSPEALDNYLKQECGHLEDQASDEFLVYLSQRIGRPMTDKQKAWILTEIKFEMMAPPTWPRRMAVDAYRSVIK